MFQDSYYDNKPNRRGCNLPNSNEDWQFENSKSVKIMGNKPMTVPKLNLAAILPQNREVEEVRFLELSMDKQIKMVAEGYNGDEPIADLRKRLDVSQSVLYDRIDKAKAIGLITEARGSGAGRPIKGQKLDNQEVTAGAVKSEMIVPPKATVEDFAKVAGEKLELAEKLAKEAERLQQAGKIALAIEELLTERAGRVIAALYAEVAV